MRQGQNYFTTCGTCGGMGHVSDNCPVKALYHSQAVRALARGSKDPEVIREADNLKDFSNHGHQADGTSAKENMQ